LEEVVASERQTKSKWEEKNRDNKEIFGPSTRERGKLRFDLNEKKRRKNNRKPLGGGESRTKVLGGHMKSQMGTVFVQRDLRGGARGARTWLKIRRKT